jgi:hypothetical protein
MIELQRILAPTDFSEYSAEAIGYGCALSGDRGIVAKRLQLLLLEASKRCINDLSEMRGSVLLSAAIGVAFVAYCSVFLSTTKVGSQMTLS